MSKKYAASFTVLVNVEFEDKGECTLEDYAYEALRDKVGSGLLAGTDIEGPPDLEEL